MKHSVKNYLYLVGLAWMLYLVILTMIMLNLNRGIIFTNEIIIHFPEREELLEEVGNLRNMQHINYYNMVNYDVEYGSAMDLGIRPHPLLPSGVNEADDRIEDQLNFIPISPQKTKVILDLINQIPLNKLGQKIFLERECPVNNCVFSLLRANKMNGTVTYENLETADAILVGNMLKKQIPKFPHQVWILSSLESAINTANPRHFTDKINWTLTYRRDSTIVTPYFKYKPYGNFSSVPKQRNYAAGKQKLVAWFVSNCRSRSGRLKYAEELQEFIPVDIYGVCSSMQCKRGSSKCDHMLEKDYKFYLSFENSLCKDYITEKLVTALGHDIVPVVMGASYEDYLLAAPRNSFIHVDNFTSPKDLANYLLYLNENDEEYNKYFQWKDTGYFMDTKTECRICAMLHADLPNVWYPDIGNWWITPDQTCRTSKYSDADTAINKEMLDKMRHEP